ncbi:hypothetical protein BU24DRAFT_267754 [Aaosphaeria arxii CBS 175.79]|uniref:Uncharacterized protein n=1 Tax=Aaosphaeria arxii CBS 175.79 TaxID=1450172 RepID=A0A6A5XGU9_9PLEO|nr:uncharacterized protein BU24DRAFT_267754 [Aaosphaeria arxii CBS 175.79]KAF2012021.1 hypothetical protein BU24DRAFT_267754 [Aaosphaeria arxii CBS 175.79]
MTPNYLNHRAFTPPPAAHSLTIHRNTLHHPRSHKTKHNPPFTRTQFVPKPLTPPQHSHIHASQTITSRRKKQTQPTHTSRRHPA